MNPFDLFSSSYTFKCTYLSPLTSQKNVPKGMGKLHEYLAERNKSISSRKVVVKDKSIYQQEH